MPKKTKKNKKNNGFAYLYFPKPHDNYAVGDKRINWVGVSEILLARQMR